MVGSGRSSEVALSLRSVLSARFLTSPSSEKRPAQSTGSIAFYRQIFHHDVLLRPPGAADQIVEVLAER